MSVIFLGPLPPPVTGLSNSVNILYTNFKSEKFVVDLNYSNKSILNKLFIVFRALAKLFFIIVTNPKARTAYYTISYSKFGLIRDIVFVTLLNLFKVKIVCHFYGAGFNQLLLSSPSYLRTLAIRTFNRIHTIIILIDEMRDELGLLNPTINIVSIPLYYDPILENYEFSIESGDRITLAFYSNIMYSKGLTFLLEAFKDISQKYSNVDLIVAGEFIEDDFMDASTIKQTISDHINQSSGNITLFGTISGKKKVDFLAKSDILVLPTFYKKEGVPISIIEAMRCGTVIVTTNHNYLKYLIGQENGDVVSIKSSKEIFVAIEKYLQDRSSLRRTQLYNYTLAKATFSTDSFLRNVYQHLVD